MKLTVFGKILAVVLLAALAVVTICAVEWLEGLDVQWGIFAIAAGVSVAITAAFNLERRR